MTGLPGKLPVQLMHWPVLIDVSLTGKLPVQLMHWPV